MKNRVILHCDMNNFYASVECKKNPSISALPVAVGGDIEERTGIILAKNYIAKSYGVKTGETLYEAREKCPGLIIIPPDFREYVKYSQKARVIYEKYTDVVEPFGLDECWLDVTESQRLFGCGEEIADRIRNDIKCQLGITASVGVSFNKIFAKLGSDIKKPDAVTVITLDNFKDVVWKMPVGDLIGVGRKNRIKLNSVGIYTIGQLANYPCCELTAMLGKCGMEVWKYANGLDDSPVVSKKLYLPDKSISHGMTLRRDMTDKNDVWCVMLELCQEIGHRLYFCNMSAKGISIHIKSTDLKVKQWQKKLSFNVQSPFVMAKEAFALFEANYKWHLPVRAVSVGAINLCQNSEMEQVGLFDIADSKGLNLDMAVEKLRGRFGNSIIKNACLLNHPLLKNDSSSLAEKVSCERRAADGV